MLSSQSIVSPSRSGRAIHGEVDGLDMGRQHIQRFDLLRHPHKPQKQPYPICANKSRNVQHRCGGSWAGPTLPVTQPGILFRRSMIWCTSDFSFRYFRTIENWCKAPVKILSSFFRRGAWPLRPHSGRAIARCSWQRHSWRLDRTWKQNRHQKVFNRVLYNMNFDKNSTDKQCFIIQFGGVRSMFGELSPRGDGTGWKYGVS